MSNKKKLEAYLDSMSFYERYIEHLPYRFWWPIEDAYTSVKYAWQRVFRGYDDRAYWSLDSYITNIAVPSLTNLRRNGHGLPSNPKTGKTYTQKQWDAKLGKMITAFELIQADYDCTLDHDGWRKKEWESYHKKVNDGLREFAEHFRSLWD
jgi:hypothetical protein